MIITSPNASDIIELFRPATFDRHVQAYRQAKFISDRQIDFALRGQAVDAEADRIIARAPGLRCPPIRQAAA